MLSLAREVLFRLDGALVSSLQYNSCSCTAGVERKSHRYPVGEGHRQLGLDGWATALRFSRSKLDPTSDKTRSYSSVPTPFSCRPTRVSMISSM